MVLGAGVEEGRRTETDPGLERDRHRSVDARDLLDGDAVREVVGATAAVFLGKREAEQPELAHRVDGVDRELVVAIPGLGVGSDLALGEIADDGPELLLLWRRIELHGHDRTRRSTVRPVDAYPGYAVVRDGAHWIVCTRPTRALLARGADVFAALDQIAGEGFWVGFVAYDAGRAIEHTAPRIDDDLGLPDLAFVRFDDTCTVDELPPPGTFAGTPGAFASGCELGRGRSSLTPGEHAALVARVHDLLAAGECYQVNLTRRLTFDAAPDPFDLFSALARLNPAPHAAVCSFGDALPGIAVVSASPELFLRVDGRSVETRPIKGTAIDASTLRTSEKDRAENLMIVDLARNDLGRVCEFGSIDVPALFAIEDHPGLAHLVSTVQGRLRPDVGLADLIRATFPPASVTGAPKPRVMQAIEELEPVRRGVYCGAFGWIDATRDRAELAVAIRTFTIAAGQTHLGIGGGIVADSCAHDEWAETELKGARLLQAAGARRDETVDVR